MHFAARRDDVLLVKFEVEVEMRERVLLDVAADVAQRLKLGKARHDLATTQRKTAPRHDFERLLQVRVGEAGAGVRREFPAGCFHQR